MTEGGLAQAGRPEDQHVVERVATPLGRLDVDFHLLAHRYLAEVVGKALGADAGVGGVILAGGAGADDAVVGHVLIMRQKYGFRPGCARHPQRQRQHPEQQPKRASWGMAGWVRLRGTP